MPPIPTQNRRVVLAQRPNRGPITSKTFNLETSKIGELSDGQILVKVVYTSIDPTMRNWLNDARSYMRPIDIGEPMRAAGIGRVVGSKSKKFAPGDLVYGTLNWQEYWQGGDDKVERRERPKGGQDIDHLGLLGTSGLTAYFGMFDVGRLKDGDTVLISGAAGSVGLIACQIALAHPKCKVIALASKSKLAQLEKLGCHTVLDYTDPGFKKNLRKATEGLIDVYFDNVGGEILDLALSRMKPYGRVVCCGAIAAYNAEKPPPIYNTPTIVSMKLTVQGFIILDYATRFAEGRAYLADLRAKGKVDYAYHITEGLENCVGALEEVFRGGNYGKASELARRHVKENEGLRFMQPDGRLTYMHD